MNRKVSDSAQAANLYQTLNEDKNRHKWNKFAAEQEIMLMKFITVKVTQLLSKL